MRDNICYVLHNMENLMDRPVAVGAGHARSRDWLERGTPAQTVAEGTGLMVDEVLALGGEVKSSGLRKCRP